MKNLSSVAVLASVFASSPGLHSQTPSGVMEETIVYASDSNELAEQPRAVTELTSEDLFERSVRSLPEALSTVPGVMVQKTSNGQGSPYIRGFTGYRTLLSLDGIRYNNSVYRDGPSEYFGLIDHFSVANMEVYAGPESIRYGSDAVGGVLAVHSKGSGFLDFEDGKAFQKGTALYRFAGAEKSHQARLEYQLGVGGDWGLHVGGTLKDFGAVRAAEVGTQEKTGYDERAFDLKFEKQLAPGWVFTAARQDLTQDDVWRSHSTIFGTSFAGTSVGSDLVRLKDQARSLTYAKLEGEPLASWLDKVEATLSYQTWDEDGVRVRSDGRRADESFDSRMVGFDLKMESPLGAGVLRYGGEVYRDEVDSARVDTSATGVATTAVQGPVGDDAVSESAGIFAEVEMPLSEQFTLHLGGRWSYNRVEVGRYLNPLTGLPDSLSDSWQTTVGSARISWAPDLTSNTSYWLGLSQSFRAPNLADLTRYGGSRSNEIESAALDLEPETFLTGEVGARWTGGWGRLELNYHATWIDNYIASTPTGRIIDGEVEVTKRNSSSGFIQGVELNGHWELGNCWTLAGQFSWLEGELDVIDSTRPDAGREPLSRLMPLTLRGALRWTHPAESYWIELEAIHALDADQLSAGDIADDQRIPPGGTPGYTVVNLRGGYQINEQLYAQAGISNLFNEAYRVHGSGDNEPGIGLDCSLRYQF